MYVKHQYIKDINLGGLAAEHDNYLEQYFYESDLFRRVALGYTRILIGNRGSGKSAIFKMLAQKERAEGTLVQEILPSDYIYDLLKNSRLFESQAEWARLGAYTASWKYVILTTAMRMLHNRYKNQKAHSEPVKMIHAYLRDHIEEHEKTPIDILVKFIKKFGNVTNISLDGLQFADKTNELEKLYKLESLAKVIPAIQELSRYSRILILFDELDHGWDASTDARQFIAGLFKAAIQINNQFLNIHVLVTIREEIYQNIPELYDDAQKIRDIIEYLRWTPEELKVMIAQRIKHSLECSLNKDVRETRADTIWEIIFQKAIEHVETSTFNYIVDRTLYRPRELIFFINECFKAHNIEERIGQETIKKVERTYSMNRLEDIASEYRFRYGGLREIFETFRLGAIRWTRGALEDRWLEIVEGEKCCPKADDWLNETSSPQKLIEVLWSVGFLRAFIKTDREPIDEDERHYVGYHQEPTLNIAMINFFDIHPMFRSHLGII